MRIDALGIDSWRSDERFGQHGCDAPDDPCAGQKHNGRSSELDDAGDPANQVDLRESEIGDNWRGQEKKKRQDKRSNAWRNGRSLLPRRDRRDTERNKSATATKEQEEGDPLPDGLPRNRERSHGGSALIQANGIIQPPC